jgi:hypothetical protein
MHWIWRLGGAFLLLLLLVLCLANPVLLLPVLFSLLLLIVVPRLSSAIRRRRATSSYGRKDNAATAKLAIALAAVLIAGGILRAVLLSEEEPSETGVPPSITQSLPATYDAVMQYDDALARWELRESIMLDLDPIRDITNADRVQGAVLRALETNGWQLEGLVDGRIRSLRNRSVEADVRLLPTPTIHEVRMTLPTVHLDPRIWYPAWLFKDPMLQQLTTSMGLTPHHDAVLGRVAVQEIPRIKHLLSRAADGTSLVKLNRILQSIVTNRPPDLLKLAITDESEARLIGTRFEILETYPPSQPVERLKGDEQERVISLTESAVLRVSLLSPPFRNPLGMKVVGFAHAGIAWGIVLALVALAGATLKAEFQTRVLTPLVRRAWNSLRKGATDTSHQTESSTSAQTPAVDSTARLEREK